MQTWLAIPLLLAATLCAAAENHFPQPVRVGNLIGQKLIAPRESQPLLGTVEALARDADGALTVHVKIARLLPGGGRSVSVPIVAVSYLGPQLALTGLTETQLDALPEAAASPSIPVDEVIRIDLVKPFH